MLSRRGGLTALAVVLGVLSLYHAAGLVWGSVPSRGLIGALGVHLGVLTFWANVLIGVAALVAALPGGWGDRRVALVAGAAVIGAFVFLVYHGVLTDGGRILGPKDFDDFLRHTLAPVGIMAVWLGLVPRGRLRPSMVLGWLGFVWVYAAFTLTRSAMTGSYPYFLIDVPEYGVPRVALNILGLTVAFAALGLAAVWLDRRLARSR